MESAQTARAAWQRYCLAMRHSVELLTTTAPTAALPTQKATPRYSCSESMSEEGTPSEIANWGCKKKK